MNEKKFWSKVGRHLTEHPFLPYLYLFAFIGFIIVGYSYFKGLLFEAEFQKGILVESFGMLFDLLIIGAVIGFIHSKGERRREIRRYMEEIDDFRGWKSDEAKFRIVGNIKRLNRNGVTNINLYRCYLEKAELQYVELHGANLRYSNLGGVHFYKVHLRGASLDYANLRGAHLKFANLQGANFWGALLYDVNLQGADLKETKGLTIDLLSNVKTLYEAQLEPELEKQVKEKYPHLLEKPKEEK